MPTSPTDFDLAPLLLRAGLDVAALVAVVGGVYRRRYGRSEILATLVVFNVVIFALTYTLNQVSMTMGAAFGLFAVFSLLRYRTESITAREMTYLFVSIALGLLLAVATLPTAVLAAIAVGCPTLLWLLEQPWFASGDEAQPAQYDIPRLLAPDRREELLEDLRRRTGLAVTRVDVHELDLVKDMARITIFHRAR